MQSKNEHKIIDNLEMAMQCVLLEYSNQISKLFLLLILFCHIFQNLMLFWKKNIPDSIMQESGKSQDSCQRKKIPREVN